MFIWGQDKLAAPEKNSFNFIFKSDNHLYSSVNDFFNQGGIKHYATGFDILFLSQIADTPDVDRLQGVQRSGKSQGNSIPGKSQGIVREFCYGSGKIKNVVKSQGILNGSWLWWFHE